MVTKVNSDHRDDDTQQDVWEAIVDAYDEGEKFTLSVHADDFDYTYRPICVDKEGESAILQNPTDRGPHMLKVSMSSGDHAEVFVLDREYGSTFIGNAYGVRETRY